MNATAINMKKREMKNFFIRISFIEKAKIRKLLKKMYFCALI
jgi:hypothetical protein